MVVKFDFDEEIVHELIKRSLEDMEPIADKLVYLVDLGWRADKALREHRVIIAIPSDTHPSYRRNLNATVVAGEFRDN